MLLAIQIICVTALLCYLGLLMIVGWNARKTEPRVFLLFLIPMFIWQLSITIITFSADPDQSLFWYRVSLGLGGSFGLFYAVFVREMLGIRRHPWVIYIGYLLAVFFAFWTLTGRPYVVDGVYQDPRVPMWLPELGPLTNLIGLYLYGFLAYGMIHLIKCYREVNSPVVRNRYKYLLIGVTLVLFGSTVNLSDSIKVYPIDITANVINALLIAYAILRFQLLDISLVARKGLLYSIPTAILGAGYFLVIILAVNIFHFVTGYQILLLSIVIAAITAVAVQPFWSRLQDLLDRLFFREKYDANLMIQRLSRTVSSVLDLERLTAMILDEITGTIHIQNAALLLKSGDSDEYSVMTQKGVDQDVELSLRADNPIVVWLSKHKDVLTKNDVDVMPQFKALWDKERRLLDEIGVNLFIPLSARDALIGILLLGPKRSEVPYSRDEKLALMTLANQTAIAVQNAWLYQMAIDEKERAQTILQHAFAGIMVIDPGMRIVEVNHGAETITGYSAEELVGKRFIEVFHSEMWDEGSPLFTAMATDESVSPVETLLAGRNGTRNILLGVTPIYDGFLLNFADVTKLREVDRLKSNIVANVSHELRTPLASIKGYADLLLEEFEGNDRQMRLRFLSIINKETDRLARFVTELLDLSRLESGQIAPQMEELYLEDIVFESTEMLDLQAREAAVNFQIDVEDDLPTLQGNRDLLRSLVKNLISNAIKFSPDGGQVRVVVRRMDSSLVLEVVDHGIGIPPEDLPHLFTKFYRSKAVQLAGIKGTGLGLALAKEAADVHGGTIDVVSEAGAGTRFTVVLPILREEDVDSLWQRQDGAKESSQEGESNAGAVVDPSLLPPQARINNHRPRNSGDILGQR